MISAHIEVAKATVLTILISLILFQVWIIKFIGERTVQEPAAEKLIEQLILNMVLIAIIGV